MRLNLRQFAILPTLGLLVLMGTAAPKAQYGRKSGAPEWLERERHFALRAIEDHLDRDDVTPGAVIASPSRENPDYYFHWVRDAGLVMDPIVTLYGGAESANRRAHYLGRIRNFLDFSLSNQRARSLTGLGEPKFHVDGRPFDGPWGRPQNDGPALRAIAFARFAEQLLQEGQLNWVRRHLYDGRLPSASVIKTDLEYISHEWRAPSFDLWEEVLGDHFYTRMVQRKALLLGARLAERLQDPGASAWYRSQARLIEREMEKFWDPRRGYVIATVNRRGGLDYKHSELDVSVLLGALHGGMGDGFFDLSDARVQRTVDAIVNKFASLYPINERGRGIPGVAIGRYPEDRYGGSDFHGGNPWVLATLAVAEAYYFRAKTDAGYLAKADSFVARVMYHSHADGSLSEQMHRETGFMHSAEDLTWNYGAILTAAAARDRAVAAARRFHRRR